MERLNHAEWNLTSGTISGGRSAPLESALQLLESVATKCNIIRYFRVYPAQIEHLCNLGVVG